MESDKFAERILLDITAASGVMHLYLGSKLKLWQAMMEFPNSSCTPAQLASKAGIAPRYALEWLRSCAAFGYLKYEVPSSKKGPSGASDKKTEVKSELEDEKYHEVFTLPPSHAEVLTNTLSPCYMGMFPAFLPSIAQVMPQLLEAFKTGKGVPYESYGRDCVEAIGETNRALFHNEIDHWISKLPDVYEHLRSYQAKSDKDQLRIADLGCGKGYSSVKLAELFPQAVVEAVDLDEISIKAAREHVKASKLEQRVRLHCCMADKADIPKASCDLVTMFECLHDISNPVEVLQQARALLRPKKGVLLVADERVEDRLEDMLYNHSSHSSQHQDGASQMPPTMSENPKSVLGRLNYGFSTLHCLPASLALPNSSGLGTCGVTPSRMKVMAKEAGFKSCEIVHESDFWRFFRLQSD